MALLTKRLLIRTGASLFLLAALAVFESGCAKQSAFQKLDPAVAELLLPDTNLLAGIDVDGLRKTPAYGKYKEVMQTPKAQEMARRNAVFSLVDVGSLIVTSNGKDFAVLARGRFPLPTLEEKLVSEGLQRFPYKGHKLLGDGNGVIVFLNSSLAVAGTLRSVQAVIDHRDRPSGVPPDLAALLKTIPARSHLWLISAGGVPSFVPPTGNMANLDRIFRSLKSLTLSADLGNGLKLASEGACINDADAGQLQGALRGFIAMGRLSTPTDQRDRLRFFDAFQVKQDGAKVRLDAEVPPDLWGKMLTEAQKSAGEALGLPGTAGSPVQ